MVDGVKRRAEVKKGQCSNLPYIYSQMMCKLTKQQPLLSDADGKPTAEPEIIVVSMTDKVHSSNTLYELCY
jgi:hypothetical protein